MFDDLISLKNQFKILTKDQMYSIKGGRWWNTTYKYIKGNNGATGTDIGNDQSTTANTVGTGGIDDGKRWTDSAP